MRRSVLLRTPLVHPIRIVPLGHPWSKHFFLYPMIVDRTGAFYESPVKDPGEQEGVRKEGERRWDIDLHEKGLTRTQGIRFPLGAASIPWMAPERSPQTLPGLPTAYARPGFS